MIKPVAEHLRLLPHFNPTLLKQYKGVWSRSCSAISSISRHHQAYTSFNVTLIHINIGHYIVLNRRRLEPSSTARGRLHHDHYHQAIISNHHSNLAYHYHLCNSLLRSRLQSRQSRCLEPLEPLQKPLQDLDYFVISIPVTFKFKQLRSSKVVLIYLLFLLASFSFHQRLYKASIFNA